MKDEAERNAENMKEEELAEEKKAKKKVLAIHDRSVHVLVNELSKQDDVRIKPQLNEKKTRKKKLDISSLMER